jgi:hypothetical protein
MGRTVYVALANTGAQLQAALADIRAHNTHPDDDEVGEEIEDEGCLVRVKAGGAADVYLEVSNGGGGRSTWEFLEKRAKACWMSAGDVPGFTQAPMWKSGKLADLLQWVPA